MTLQTFVPLQFKRRQGRLVDTEQPGFDPVLLEAIGRAFHWQQMIDSGVAASSADIARMEKLNPSSVTRLLRLALLSPDIISLPLSGETTANSDLGMAEAPPPAERLAGATANHPAIRLTRKPCPRKTPS